MFISSGLETRDLCGQKITISRYFENQGAGQKIAVHESANRAFMADRGR